MNNLFLIFLFILIISCQSMGDAKKVLTNQKTKTTDEFLVKKKQPLELPPEFDKLPIPDSVTNKKEKSLSEDEKIKDILRTTKQEKKGNENFSSTEKAILDKIRK